MIRPFTLICMVSAFGAGLYLYQSKHAAQVLDREITRTIKQTETTRERTGMLRAEWALLNEPDRLADLARAHLSLQTLKPTQFTAMNDLASRLPAPVAAHLEPLAEPDDAAPVAEAAPAPVPAPVATPAPKPREVASAPEPKPKPESRPERAVAEAKPARPADKPVVARAEPPRPAEPAAFATPVHARPFAPPPPANADATAPGTVGAAVLRAMQAQGGGYAPAPPIRAAAPPAYVQPAYAPPPYAPTPSVLGGRPALPPPVPFAAR